MNLDPGAIIASIISILFIVGTSSILISIIFEENKTNNQIEKRKNTTDNDAFVFIEDD